MGKLTYQTLRENVVDIIRSKVFNHELEPGTRIIEQDLSDELGVSRGPIREALRQLEQEGLVEYVRNVGCSVKGISLEDIYEIYLLRATYEIISVQLSKGKFPEETLAEMDRALELMKALKDTDYEKTIAYDNMLHGAIIRIIGLPRLVKSWSDLNYGNAMNYHAGNSDSEAMMERQYPVHKELVDVFRTGSVEDICRTIWNHYMKTVKRVLKEQGLSEDHFKFSINAIDRWI